MNKKEKNNSSFTRGLLSFIIIGALGTIINVLLIWIVVLLLQLYGNS